MNDEDISGEHALSQQDPPLQSQQNPETPSEILDSLDNVDDASHLDILDLEEELETEVNSKKKISWTVILGWVLFINIAMIIGIVIVCLTTPQPSNLCEVKIQSIKNETSSHGDSNPRSVVAGDINHDHLMDIVVVNSGSNNIGIFLGYGNGTFASQMILTTDERSRPVSVVLGDLNNDTHVDIVVANYDTHTIGIFLGYGNGTFEYQIKFNTDTSRPVSMAVGDLNNDHWLDIVVTNNGTNTIGIFFGHGNGTFTNQITYSTGYDSLPSSVVVNDFNNDHYLDIVVTNYGTNNIGVFLGNENGSFQTQTIYSTGPQSNPHSIVADDFNNDGQLDLAVANSGSDNVGIFFGCGNNGSFRSPKTYSLSPGSRPYSIISGDFNQDKQVDIAVANYDTNNINILIGDGNGTFSIPTIHSTGVNSTPLGITVGDVDNDDQLDIVVANFGTNNIYVFIEYTMIQSQNPRRYSTGDGSIPRQVITGDLNHDSHLDLVVANYGTDNVGVFLGYGNGSFPEQITYSTGSGSHLRGVAVGDLDNDNQLDLIVANFNTESVGILYGFGNGSFDTVVTLSTGKSSSPRCVTIEDFNNDHHLDIAFVDFGFNAIGIFLGYGNRTFGKAMKYISGPYSRPYSLATGDFNNDASVDIVVANYGSDSVAILLGLGNGTMTLFTIYASGDGSFPAMVTTADLNNDNYVDVIVANSGTNSIGVFFGFGNGSFATQLTYPTGVGSGPVWVSIADFNDDGWLDLAIANQNNDNIGVLLGGNRQNYFSNQTLYSSGPNSAPCSMTIGDFNRDQRLDIAVLAFIINSIVILLGHSSDLTTNDKPIRLGDYYAGFQSQTVLSTGSNPHPYSFAVGDLNNDTHMDLIVANSGHDNLGLLLGYGDGFFAPQTIYSLDTGSNPQNVLAHDFNGDHQLDVAVTNPNNNNIVVLLGNGHGTFSRKLKYSTGLGSQPNALAIGNFDNDKYLDLIVANMGTNTIGIFFGLDYTFFARQKPCDSGAASNPYSIVTGDFNHDGNLDIVSGLYGSNNVGVFLGYGNGAFASLMTFSKVTASHSRAIIAGDFNNDNHLDIALANWGIDSIGILLGYGNGSFANSILYPTGSNTRPLSISVGDFNNDSCLDITTANYGGNSVTVLLGYGNGSFQNGKTLSTGPSSRPRSVAVFDINNDTNLDIIVTNDGLSGVSIFLGFGNASFARQAVYSTGVSSFPRSVTAGDFNKDGYLDLAVANYGTSSIGILYGYGNGTFANVQTYTTGSGSSPTKVVVADCNNDTHLDIIVGDETSTTVGIFFGYNDGTFASVSAIPIEKGTYTYSIAVGDFNKDNRPDFALSDTGYNNIRVFLANGSKPFGGQTTFFIGNDSSPSSIAVGNFNNDSHLDISIANYGTDTIGILLGHGNRMFSNLTTYSIGNNSQPLSVAIGDFNNDSRTDIAVANSGTNNIAVLIGYGDGSFYTSTINTMHDRSLPVSVAIGDFNKDHRLDIAVANYGTNNMCILFGLGNGTFTNQTWYALGYDSDPNWVVFNDLNNDGWEDIAVMTYGKDNINILFNLC